MDGRGAWAVKAMAGLLSKFKLRILPAKSTCRDAALLIQIPDKNRNIVGCVGRTYNNYCRFEIVV